MFRKRDWTPMLLAVCLLASCSRKSEGGQHATVLLRDGSSVSGTVLSTSASEIQIAGDDKSSHDIAMAQVRSIEYDEAAPSAPAQADIPHQDHYHPAESAITTKIYSIAAGTRISVRNEETIDSGKAVEGQLFSSEVTKDVLDASGDVVIPRGSNAQIVIRSASKGGKIRGASDLVMDLDSVSVDGRQYQLSTVDLAERGHSGVGKNRRTGEFAGGGAAIGAIIGALAGGGKGAAIGAGSGAGAGALTEIVTKGTIKVPVETILTFRLDQALRVTAAQ